MKVNVTFDMTPAEFRQVLGLPDVQHFQQELMSQMMDKMKAGEEGYDPVSLYQPMFSQSVDNMNKFQKMMFDSMTGQSSDKS